MQLMDCPAEGPIHSLYTLLQPRKASSGLPIGYCTLLCRDPGVAHALQSDMWTFKLLKCSWRLCLS
jgi:hypothetical protein